MRVWELNQTLMNITVDKQTTSKLIGGLKPGTRYEVIVLAFTSAGDGNATSLSVNTLAGEISLVEWLQS